MVDMGAYGMVRVIAGKHKGKIGEYDNEYNNKKAVVLLHDCDDPEIIIGFDKIEPLEKTESNGK